MIRDIIARLSCGCIPRSRRSGISASDPAHTPAADRPSSHQHNSESNNHEQPQSSSFHARAQEIAQIPVSGMLRTPGSGQTSCYISTYQPAQQKGPHAPGTPPSKTRDGRVANDETDTSGETLVGSPVDTEKKGEYGQDLNKSTWQGRPNGTAYDRREELTEEDEDMWARMAM